MVGFTLDGKFVLSDSPVRCHAVDSAAHGGHDARARAALVAHLDKAGLACSAGALSDLTVADGHAALKDALPAAVAHLALPKAKGSRHGARHQDPRATSAGRRRLFEGAMGSMQPKYGDAEVVEAEARRGAGPTAALDLSTGSSTDPDAETSYVRGVKTVFVATVLPSDGDVSLPGPKGYSNQLVASAHGGDPVAYFAAVMETANQYMIVSSWGTLSLNVTMTPVLTLPYLADDCGSLSLNHWIDPESQDYDNLAYKAAALLDPPLNAVADFDFQVTFVPYCRFSYPDPRVGIPFGGVGWVGIPGTVQAQALNDYDQSVAHEMGHNFGALHASYIDDGARAAVAWGSSSSTGWIEYGNPHSTMGQGNMWTSSGAPQNPDFMVEGKTTYDWLGDAEMSDVAPYNSGNSPTCVDCGTFELWPTDTGVLPSDTAGAMGLRIATGKANRWLYVEHRTSTTGGSAVIVTWADVAPYSFSSYGTGQYGNTVILDCTPATGSWDDAGCAAGATFEVDVSAEGSPGTRPVFLAVSEGSKPGHLAVNVRTSLHSMAPSVSPAPTVACREVVLLLVDSWGDGWNGNVMTIDAQTYTIEAGSEATYEVCLVPGTYPVTVCGGYFDSEVSWAIELKATGEVLLSGGADDDCASWGSFTVGGGDDGFLEMPPAYHATVRFFEELGKEL